MTIAPTLSTTTTFRFTSIEPLTPLNEQLEEIARSNGCEYAVNSTSIVNAPFCGVRYHVQEVSLCSNTTTDHTENMAHCIEQFTRIETEQLADGFFEIVN